MAIPISTKLSQSISQYFRVRQEATRLYSLNPGRALLQRNTQPGAILLQYDGSREFVVALSCRQFRRDSGVRTWCNQWARLSVGKKA